MGKKDENLKAKTERESKEREKSKSYASDDPFKIRPNKSGKK